MINHKHRVIFIHLPRTAGTAFEAAIQGRDQAHVPDGVWLKHISQARAEKEYSQYWGDYKKFTIVRNPFDWLVSYVHLDARRICNVYGPLSNHSEKQFKFKRFVKRLVKTNNLNAIPSPGWFEQSCKYFDTFDPADMDLIIKFEELEQGVDDLSELLGFEISLPSRDQLVAGGNYPKTKRRKNYKSYYDKRTERLVTDLFSEELAYFNYEF